MVWQKLWIGIGLGAAFMGVANAEMVVVPDAALRGTVSPVAPVYGIIGFPMPDKIKVRKDMADGTNACARLVVAVVDHPDDPNIPQWKNGCANHPMKEVCASYLSQIRSESTKDANFSCVGAG